MVQQPLVKQGLLKTETSRLHSDTPHPVRLLWTSDQLDAKPLPDSTLYTQESDIHAPGREKNPQPQQEGGRRRTPSDRTATAIGTLACSDTKYRVTIKEINTLNVM